MNPLIEKYGATPRWVGHKNKIPYTPKGRKASSTDPLTWSTFDDVALAGLPPGIVFTPDRLLLGVDIDKCLKEGHAPEDIEAFVALADTYTEVSPSGSGLHLFLETTTPLDLKANRHSPFEVYNVGRYFTFTGKPYGKMKPLRTVTPSEAEALLSSIGYPWQSFPTREPVKDMIPVALEDSTVLEKMFASKNGKELHSLWNGDLTEYKGDDSKADMALASALAFWTGKNATQMERLWLSAPIGQREKTKTRQDYRTRTINKAIALCTNVYSLPAQKISEDDTATNLDLLFIVTKEGKKEYIQNTENIYRILSGHENFTGRLRYDAFKNTYEIKPTKTNVWRAVEDYDAISLQTAISVLFPCFMRVGKEMVFDAMVKTCKENAIDSGRDYITSLKWDGKARLDSWLTKVYGAPEDVYHQKAGSNWIKGLVSRIVYPGCKFDYVLVLEGEQGAKKSTSLHVLGLDWHVETTMSTDSKDFFMQFQGKAIIEFSEGETLSRTEVKRMKAIITMQYDKYRPPYERTSQDFPRRCVFAMTTNQTEYLKDDTGNRRWLPVRVVLPEANIEWLKENREQLFAEAYHRIAVLGENAYEMPKDETRQAQEDRMISNSNHDTIIEWYMKLGEEQRSKGVTILMAYKELMAGSFSTKPIDNYQQAMISHVFKNMLFLEQVRIRVNGTQPRVWVPTAKTPQSTTITIDELSL